MSQRCRCAAVFIFSFRSLRDYDEDTLQSCLCCRLGIDDAEDGGQRVHSVFQNSEEKHTRHKRSCGEWKVQLPCNFWPCLTGPGATPLFRILFIGDTDGVLDVERSELATSAHLYFVAWSPKVHGSSAESRLKAGKVQTAAPSAGAASR